MSREQPAPEHNDDRAFAELIKLARDGDDHALGKMIAQIRDYLLLIANERMDEDIKGKVGASDMVQQSLMAAHANFPDFKGTTRPQFIAWLRQILVNDVKDAQRKYRQTQRRQIQRENSINDSHLIDPALADQLLTPSSEAIENEQTRLIRSVIEALPDKYSAVIKLRNWQEMSFRQIGDEFECSEDAARKLWYRAMVRLQEELQKQLPQFKSNPN